MDDDNWFEAMDNDEDRPEGDYSGYPDDDDLECYFIDQEVT